MENNIEVLTVSVLSIDPRSLFFSSFSSNEPKLSEQQKAELLSAAETISGVVDGDFDLVRTPLV